MSRALALASEREDIENGDAEDASSGSTGCEGGSGDDDDELDFEACCRCCRGAATRSKLGGGAKYMALSREDWEPCSSRASPSTRSSWASRTTSQPHSSWASWLMTQDSDDKERSRDYDGRDEDVSRGSSARSGGAVPSEGFSICGYRPDLTRPQLVFSTCLVLVDQYLDGVVLGHLAQHVKVIAGVLAASIIVPQVLAWAFLHANNMTSYKSLLRVLAFPAVSGVILVGVWLSGTSCPRKVREVLLFCVAVSLDPFAQLVKDWKTGAKGKEATWASIAEGQIEAPSSSVLTLYPAMLISAVTGKGVSLLFFASSAWSMVCITKSSVDLHFYGQEATTVEKVIVALRDKLPSVVSQVLAYALFGFLTRPYPVSTDDLHGHSTCHAVWVILLMELGSNFGMLRTASPQMRRGVAAFLASAMVVAGPPGFLDALDAARSAHGLQHFLLVLVMAAWASMTAKPEHWRILAEHYAPCILVFAVTTLWSFAASQWRGGQDLPVAQRVHQATQRLDKALLERDPIMVGLMLDVDGADGQPGAVGGDWALPPQAFMPLGPKGEGQGKYHDVAILGGRLYCCPCNATEVLVIEPGSANKEDCISFIPLGPRGEGEWKWRGIAALGGRLYCCPDVAEDILVISPAATSEEGHVSFVPLGIKGKGGGKWEGIAALGGRLYCCPRNAEEVLVIEPGAAGEEDRISFIPLGTKGEGKNKWHSIAALGGRLYCCPCDAEEVLVIEPGAAGEEDHISFIPLGTKGQRGKWRGIAALGGRLYCCPSGAAEMLVIDPGATSEEELISFISLGLEGGESRWHGIAALGGRLYCSPTNSVDVLIIEPGESPIIWKAGAGRRPGKWVGCVAHEQSGLVYCAPHHADTVLAIDPALVPPLRTQLLAELGLGPRGRFAP